MGVVFVVLTVLAVSIKAFDRIDSLIPESGSASVPKIDSGTPTAAPEISQPSAVSESNDVRAAAAIAVALALSEADRSESISTTASSLSGLARSSGNIWVAAGRTREMANRFAGSAIRNRTGR